MRTGKVRTREHILEDYSAVHFEKNVLDCGYSVERAIHDYGIDMALHTYNAQQEIENDSVKIQLKATDKLNVLADKKTISFSAEWADLEMWGREAFPVILVIYDKKSEVAYWLCIQKYLKEKKLVREEGRQTLNVHFDMANVLNENAVRQFAAWKNELNERYQKVKERW